LRSLQTQTFGGAFEVIVVDSSREDITSLMSGRFPSVRFLRYCERKFPGEARNAGIREAAGKLLRFWMPTVLRIQTGWSRLWRRIALPIP